MNSKSKISVLAILLSLAPFSFAGAGPRALPGQQPATAVISAAMNSAPQAVFPQTKFEFDPVFEGAEIKHDFVVENKGAAPLIINSIRPD
jgi:hypothetical protein